MAPLPLRLPSRSIHCVSSFVRCTSTRPLTSKPPPPPKRRALVDLALIGGGVLALGGAALWIRHKRAAAGGVDGIAQQGSSRGQFEIPIANRTGTPPAKKTLTMLTTQETDGVLKKNEATYEVNRPGNPVYRYDTNSVASNAPIEDDSVITIVSRTPSISPSPAAGDLLFFGVFDGHGGWQTSRMLSERLVPFVGRELEAAIQGSPEYAALSLRNAIDSKDKVAAQGAFDKIWGTLTLRGAGETPRLANLDADPTVVESALRRAFMKLDEEIVQAPVKLLESLEKQGKITGPRDGSGMNEMTPEQTRALQTLLPALSGSCAILAYIDAARSRLHVATTGDSRALMGVWQPGSSGAGGKWIGRVLSEDQEGTNPKEITRIRSEHPPAESEAVIQRGRILGGLQPTRAFGDARYKWPVGIADRLYVAFHPGPPRRTPQGYLTPPYVTAEPVVTTTALPEGGNAVGPDRTKGFVVIATDGLWDRLSNEEVVGLVGAWAEGKKGKLSRKEMLRGVGEVKEAYAEAHAPKRESVGNMGYVVEDENCGTHLIRNALGGAARDQVSALLSIPAPHSRRYRDDITVTVVFLGDGPGSGPGQARVEGVRKITLASAKL